MSFTARQQHCLEAMGLVAWVSRDHDSEPQLAAPIKAQRSSDGPIPATSNLAVAGVPVDKPRHMSGDLPSDINELGTWLPEQPLANFRYKGSVHTTLGHREASVLVVVQRQVQACTDENGNAQNNRAQIPGEVPLTSDAAQLFELMMRSIGLGRSDVRQCALADSLIPAQDQSPSDQCVGNACTPHTRAIIVLLAMDESKDIAAEAHYCRLAHSQLPVWRIAHPDILLLDNQRKRQAWQSLKALQHYLTA